MRKGKSQVYLSLVTMLISRTWIRTQVFLTSEPNSQPVEKTILGSSYYCSSQGSVAKKQSTLTSWSPHWEGWINKFKMIFQEQLLSSYWRTGHHGTYCFFSRSRICHSRIIAPVPWSETCLYCGHHQGHTTPAAIHTSRTMTAPSSAFWHTQS